MAGTGIWLSDQDLSQTGGAIWAQQQIQALGTNVRAGQDWASQQIARAQQMAQAQMQSAVQTPVAPTPTVMPAAAPSPSLPEAPPPAPQPAPALESVPQPPPPPQAPPVPMPNPIQAGQDWASQQIQNLIQLNPGAQSPSTSPPIPGPPMPSQSPLGASTAIPGTQTPPTPSATPSVPGAPAGPQSAQPGDFIDQARKAAQAAGIDPDIFSRQIQQESGFNPSAVSPAGAQGIAQFMPDTARGLGIDPSDPVASLVGAAKLDAQNLQKYGGDWSKALAAYNAGPGNVDKYGGVPPFEETQNYVKTILGGAQNLVQQGVTAVNTAVDAVHSAVARVSQFGLGLSSGDAMAFCGPAAALAFAQTYGRNPTVDEAKQLAQQVGWDPNQGMAGPQSEVKLLNAMGVDAHMTSGVDWQQVGRDASGGNPVIVDTPGHYYYVDGYNADSGKFHVGTSGTDLKGGAEWMSADQINGMPQSGGQARAAIYADHPLADQSLTMSTMKPADSSGTASDNPLDLGNLGRRAQQVLQAVGDIGGGLGQDLSVQSMAQNPLMPSNILFGMPGQQQQEQALALSAQQKMLSGRQNEVTPEEQAALGSSAVRIGGMAGSLEAGPTTRMFHGTGSDFPTPDPNRLDPNALFGPGYYVTSSPEVAGGLVSRGRIGVDPATGLTSTYDPATGKFTTYMTDVGKLQAPGYAQNRPLFTDSSMQDLLGRVLDDMHDSRGYFGAGAQEEARKLFMGEGYRANYSPQQKFESLISALTNDVPNPQRYLSELAPDIMGQGGNVRAVNVPKNLNLLDADAPVPEGLVGRIQAFLDEHNPLGADAFVPDANKPLAQLTGADLYRELERSSGESYTDRDYANQVLQQLGYDGITYSGGKRIPMTDAAGAPIEHTAHVIFPESLDKITNAISGTPRGQMQVGPALALGAAGAGLAALDPDIRDKAGSILHDALTSGVPRGLTDNPLMPSNILGGLERGGLQVARGDRDPEQQQRDLSLALTAQQKMLSGRDDDVTDEERAALANEANRVAAPTGPIGPGEWARGLYRGGVISGLHTMSDVALNSVTPVLSQIAGVSRDLASFQPGRLQGRALGMGSALASSANNFLGEIARAQADPTGLIARAGPGAAQVPAWMAQGAGIFHGAFQNWQRQVGQLSELGAMAGQAASRQTALPWMQAYQDFMAHPPADALQRATAMGQRDALRGDLGTLMTGLVRGTQHLGPVGDALFPVVRMGVSAAMRLTDWTPIGLAGTVADIAKGVAGHGPYADIARGVNPLEVNPPGSAVGPVGERLSKGILGTALATWLASKALDGSVTGDGPQDPDQRKALQDAGIQFNSFQGPDGVYRSWEKLPIPLRAAFMSAGAYGDAAHEYDLAEKNRQAAGSQAYGLPDPRMAAAQRLVTEVMGDLASATPLRTYADVYNTLAGSSGSAGQAALQSATQLGANVAGGVIPLSGAIRDVAQMTDPNQRFVPSPRMPEEVLPGILQRIQANLPIAREQLPTQVDVLGRAMNNPLQGLGGLSPLRPAGGQPSPVLTAMQQAGFAPSGAPPDIPFGSLGKVTLTPAERQTYEAYRGQLLEQLASPLVNSPDFAQMPDYAQRLALQRVTQAADQAASRMLLADIAPTGTNRVQFGGVLAPVQSYGPMDATAQAQAFRRAQEHQALMQALLAG